MSREIKFRAWSKKDSDFVADYDTGEASEVRFYNGKATAFQIDLANEIVNGEHEQFDICTEIDDIDISQFTGLKDKNGVDIYEGDIVKATPDDEDAGIVIFEVKFEFGAYWVEVYGYEFDRTSMHFAATGHPYYSYEVIGNIHEHKELLEG